MTREQVQAITDALERARRRMRDTLMERVGLCDATAAIAWMIDTPEASKLSDAPNLRALSPDSIGSAWSRANLPPRAAIRRLIHRVRLRRVCAVPGTSFAAAAIACGHATIQSAARQVVDATGLATSRWLATTTPEGLDAEWMAFSVDHAATLRAFRVPVPYSARISSTNVRRMRDAA